MLAGATGLEPAASCVTGSRSIQLNYASAIVCGIEGLCKTESSQKPVPMHPQLGAALIVWRQQYRFKTGNDWVFASRLHNGRKPYWGSAIMRHYIQPLAEKLTRFATPAACCSEALESNSKCCRS
jgi:hypothetical protein